jgi:hypothetical protein
MQHGDMESKKVSTPDLRDKFVCPLYVAPPGFYAELCQNPFVEFEYVVAARELRKNQGRGLR